MEFRSLLLLTFWLLAAFPSWGQLSVGKPEWGFNGKVQPNTFNFLSVEVRNNGANAFEGELVLDDHKFGRNSSAPYKKSVFLAPNTAQIVQFYPYMPPYTGVWRLWWKGPRGVEEVSLGEVSTGPRAVVFFADPLSPSLRGVSLPVFNEANFPPTVSATDGLQAGVLDHQPRWEAARRDAFLDWLKLGGTVHLALGPDGVLPQFTDEFAILNIPGDRGDVGRGRVVKHAVPRNQITNDYLTRDGFGPQVENNERNRYDRIDDQLFRGMSNATKPNIAWSLIYLLTAVYVVLIGPVFYVFRKRDYRFVLLGFLGTVALFAWIFTVVGRRGYGEKQLYHQLGIAYSLGGDRWDVQHWVHPFATSGDTYQFSYAGPSQLYAAEGEGVRGEISQGKDGNRSFTADIPLFSSRPFFHRGVLGGVNSGLTVTQAKFSKRGELDALQLKGNPEITKNTHTALLQYSSKEYGTKFYRLRVEGDGYVLDPSKSGSLTQVAGQPSQNYGYDERRKLPEEQIGEYKTALLNLAGNDSESSSVRKLTRLANGSVRVMIFAQSPKQFELTTDQFLPGFNYILYMQDLVLPATPSQP